MTKRHSNAHWRGALYNALRRASDGVQGFCNWSAANRDRRISPKTLYKRLDGSDPAERMSIEDAELATEFMLRDVVAREGATDWLKALCARFDLVAIEVEPPPAGGSWPCEITAIIEKGFRLNECGGLISGALAQAIADRCVSKQEAEQIVEHAYREIALLLRLCRNVTRAAEGGCAIGIAEEAPDA